MAGTSADGGDVGRRWTSAGDGGRQAQKNTPLENSSGVLLGQFYGNCHKRQNRKKNESHNNPIESAEKQNYQFNP